MKKKMILFFTMLIFVFCSIANAEEIAMDYFPAEELSDEEYDAFEQENADAIVARVAEPLLAPTMVGPKGGTYTVMVNVSSEYSWTLSCSASWVHFSTTSGTGSRNVSITVDPRNVLGTNRSATIQLNYLHTASGNGKTKSATLTQNLRVVWPVAGHNTSGAISGENNNVHRANEMTTEGTSVITGLGSITSFYGARYTTNSAYKRHWAIDIDVEDSSTTTKAYAAMYGTVVQKDYSSDRGNFLVIEHEFINSSGNTVKLYTWYLHLASFKDGINLNTVVQAGQEIGIVGHTGSAGSDVHLHFALQKRIGSVRYYLNPVAYFHGSDARGVTSSFTALANNPMYVRGSSTWNFNTSWDPTYAMFTAPSTTTSSYYMKYMNAKRGSSYLYATLPD